MELYNLYAGLNSRTDYVWSQFFNTQEEAEEAAYEYAVQRYQSQEGTGNYKTWDDCYHELLKTIPEDHLTEEDVDEYYNDIIHECVDYYAILAREDSEHQ